jgi:hypothetical protein
VRPGRDAGGPPSWEELLTGAHPAFQATGRAGRGLAPRHGRAGSGDDRTPGTGLPDLPPVQDDAMGWADAAAWTTVAAAVAALLTARLGELVR